MEQTNSEILVNGKVKDTNSEEEHKLSIVWLNVFAAVFVHVCAIYGFFLCFTSAQLFTLLFGYLMYICGTLGITAGSHRLWSHRSYKARLPLKIMLLVFSSIAFQHSSFHWARDHRVHHKYSDTDIDPYSIKHGFFYAHAGWLMCKKHPGTIQKGKGIDMSDLTSDRLLMLQEKYTLLATALFCYTIPTVIPMYFWNETFANAFFVNMLRYCWTLHVIFFVNSLGHWNGVRPYNRSIRPVENFAVSLINLGECWHNFHHAFPWDYKAGEFAGYSTNFTASFIELMAKIGWAYDLRFASDDMVRKRINKTGDGSHGVYTTENVDETIVKSIPVNTKWY